MYYKPVTFTMKTLLKIFQRLDTDRLNRLVRFVLYELKTGLFMSSLNNGGLLEQQFNKIEFD